MQRFQRDLFSWDSAVRRLHRRSPLRGETSTAYPSSSRAGGGEPRSRSDRFKGLLIGGLLLAIMAVMGAGQAKTTVKDLSWFTGSWKCEVWGGTFVETWMPHSGGTILGVGKHITDGETGFMEFMSIEPDKDGVLTMWMLIGSPSAGSKEGVPFKLTSRKGKEAVFENPKNDFPSKIIYKMRPNGLLWCRIEGVENGKPSSQDFDFRKGG